MNYYEVATVKRAVKQQSILTYSSKETIPLGSIVKVPMGKSSVSGLVVRKTQKPAFNTREISLLLYPAALPQPLVELAQWLAEYYVSDLPFVVQHMLPAGLDKKRHEKEQPPPKVSTRLHKVEQLTDEQIIALTELKKDSKTALIHGVTGSGKTQLYIELAKEVKVKNKGAIILVPEIGLTTQLVDDFSQEFTDVFVVHSNQTESTRHKQWVKIMNTAAPIVIGPRSALFSPVHDLGLVVVDEAHETSYKQDKTPKYHALRAASQLASFSHAKLVLGSATPAIEDYYLAKERAAPIVRLASRVNKLKKPKIEIVDRRDKDSFTKSSFILSSPLVKAMELALKSSQQSLLFHNRRGTATMVVCTNCGWVAECPTCLLPLTHHHDFNKLICHICNYRIDSPHACPECKEPALLYKGFGTKQIVEEVRRQFPSANIARFDSDISAKQTLEERYEELYKGDIDILVGTQMVVKGLDLPKLSVVGVVLADTSLYLPDYTATERTYQLINQVIGRAGRHSDDSQVIIQSYTPEHPAIQYAVKSNYQAFYKNEIEQRKLSKYPPFSFMLQLTAERAKQSTAIEACDKLAKLIEEKYPSVEVLGPSPAFHERTRSGYRWQLVVKSKNRKVLEKIAGDDLPAKWQFDLDPINLL